MTIDVFRLQHGYAWHYQKTDFFELRKHLILIAKILSVTTIRSINCSVVSNGNGND